MTTSTPTAINAAIPWYRSPVMIGAVITILSTLVSLAPKAGAALGLTSPDAITTTVNAVFTVIALLAGVFTAAARTASPIQPVTMTQAAADVHPATQIAAIAVADDIVLTGIAAVPVVPATQSSATRTPKPPWSIDLKTPKEPPL